MIVMMGSYREVINQYCSAKKGEGNLKTGHRYEQDSHGFCLMGNTKCGETL